MLGRTDDARGAAVVGRRRLATIAVLLATCSAATSACDSGRVVNTDEARPTTQTTVTREPPKAAIDNATLADASDFAAQADGLTSYYFTSPSSRWVCAIVPRERAGCQSAAGSTIAITGAPTTVPDAAGEPSAPNAIQVDRDADAQFVTVASPGYALVPGPAVVLPFNKVLTVAGFRCNVQEATGISCLSEHSGKGFTFSADGYTLQYTDLPA